MKRTIISAILVIASAVAAFAREFTPIPNPSLLRAPPHDWGRHGWLDPLTYGSFIHYSLPV